MDGNFLKNIAVRVKDVMSLRNGMWNDVQNGIIMQNKNCGMTIMRDTIYA